MTRVRPGLFYISKLSLSTVFAAPVVEEKPTQNAGPSESASMQTRDDEETLASRFVTRLLQHLFQGFQSKNKVVRQRSVHLVSEMMTNIGEIE